MQFCLVAQALLTWRLGFVYRLLFN